MKIKRLSIVLTSLLSIGIAAPKEAKGQSLDATYIAKADSAIVLEVANPMPLNEAPNSIVAEALTRKQNVWTLGVGGIIAKDSYLSPLSYGGWAFNLSNEYSRRLCSRNHRWLLRLGSNLEAGILNNPAGNARMYSLLFDFDASALYRVKLPTEGFAKQFRIDLGPGIGIGVGGLYSNRNGNNPATLKLYSQAIGTAILGYNFDIKQWPLYVRLAFQSNLFGLGFGQDYGESYYEQFLLNDDHKGAINFTHPGKLWRTHSMLSVDMPLWNAATLRLGYRLDCYRASIKGIKSNTLSQTIVIGFVTDFYTLKGKRAIKRPANNLDYSPYYHQRP